MLCKIEFRVFLKGSTVSFLQRKIYQFNCLFFLLQFTSKTFPNNWPFPATASHCASPRPSKLSNVSAGKIPLKRRIAAQLPVNSKENPRRERPTPGMYRSRFLFISAYLSLIHTLASIASPPVA